MAYTHPINVDFGRIVARRRDELGLTQSELAARSNLSRASIASIENGRQNVHLYHLYDLASALELRRVTDLLPPRPGPARGAIAVTASHGEVSEEETASVLAAIRHLVPEADGLEAE